MKRWAVRITILAVSICALACGHVVSNGTEGSLEISRYSEPQIVWKLAQV
jgi:hypothetical protein